MFDDDDLVQPEDGGYVCYATSPITGKAVRDADGRPVVMFTLTAEEVREREEDHRRYRAERPLHVDEYTARMIVEHALDDEFSLDVDEGELEEAHPRRVARTLVSLEAVKAVCDVIRHEVMQKAGAEALREALRLIEDAKAN